MTVSPLTRRNRLLTPYLAKKMISVVLTLVSRFDFFQGEEKISTVVKNEVWRLGQTHIHVLLPVII